MFFRVHHNIKNLHNDCMRFNQYRVNKQEAPNNYSYKIHACIIVLPLYSFAKNVAGRKNWLKIIFGIIQFSNGHFVNNYKTVLSGKLIRSFAPLHPYCISNRLCVVHCGSSPRKTKSNDLDLR